MTDTPAPGAAGTAPINGEARTSEADTAKKAAQNDMSDIQTQAREDLSNLTDTARKDFDDARRAAGHYAEDRKNDAAGHVEGVASAVRRVADDLESGESPLIGRYAREISDGLERFSRDARNRSLGDLMGDVQRFGRERPGAFIAGAALLGFAASRFFAASGERSTASYNTGGSADASTHRQEVSGSYAQGHPARAYADTARTASTPALNAGKEDI